MQFPQSICREFNNTVGYFFYFFFIFFSQSSETGLGKIWETTHQLRLALLVPKKMDTFVLSAARSTSKVTDGILLMRSWSSEHLWATLVWFQLILLNNGLKPIFPCKVGIFAFSSDAWEIIKHILSANWFDQLAIHMKYWERIDDNFPMGEAWG